MLPARIFLRSSIPTQLVRNLSYSPIRRMPFAKHEIVPDVVPVAPKNIATVSYISGGKQLSNLLCVIFLVKYDNAFALCELSVSSSLGNVLTPTQVKDQPNVEWDAAEGAFYTLCMTDPGKRKKPSVKASIDKNLDKNVITFHL